MQLNIQYYLTIYTYYQKPQVFHQFLLSISPSDPQISLEKAAQIAVICAGTGGKVYELSTEDADVMHDFYEKHYSKRQQGEE